MRNKLLVFLLVICMALPLVGCSPATIDQATTEAQETVGVEPTKETVGVEPTEEAVGTEPTKDEIVVVVGSDLVSMNPLVGYQERSFLITNHMFDTLVTHDSDMNLIPGLAESWKWNDDVSLEIALRKNVKFHNGETLTSADAKFSIENSLLLKGLVAKFIKDIEIVDDNNFIIRLNAPYPPLVNELTDPAESIVPKEYFESDPDNFTKNPVGTGPYKISNYITGDYYKLERFDDYWGETAKTQYLTFKIVPEASQRTILLETGEADVAYDIPYVDAKRVEDTSNLKLLTIPSIKNVMFYLDCEDDSPIKDPTVRMAIEYAIDKAAIVKSVTYGHGTPAYGVMAEVVQDAQQPTVKREYDVEKAKSLLAEAGYANGFNLDLWTNSDQTNTEISQIVQNELSEIGIELNIIVMDTNAIFTDLAAKKPYGMVLHFFSPNSNQAMYMLSNVFYSKGASKYAYWSNAEFDSAIEEAISGKSESERSAAYTTAFEMLYEATPVIPLFTQQRLIATSDLVEGIELSRIGAHQLQNTVVYKQ